MSRSQTPLAPGGSFTESSTEADGFTIRYYEGGRGHPLVWVHGAGGPAFSFALDRLVDRHRVIVVELPGFGRSPINERTADAAQMATTLAEMITTLGVAPADVWGTSMGGVVTTHLAIEHPEVVSALVLEGPGPFRGSDTPPQRTPEEMARAFNNHPERVSYKQRSPPDPERWKLVMKLMGPGHDAELESRLGEIQAPTLALWGVDDGVIPPEGGRVYREHVRSCAHVLVHDAAHDVQGDRPETCAEIIEAFLSHGPDFELGDPDSQLNP